MAAGLGAAGAEDEANEDNHEDEHRDDGKEDPDNRSNLNSLNSCIISKSNIKREQHLIRRSMTVIIVDAGWK